MSITQPLDLADRVAGRVLDCPMLVLWGQGHFEGQETLLKIWHDWATCVEGWAIPGGPLQPEEQPDAVLEAIVPFLAHNLQ